MKILRVRRGFTTNSSGSAEWIPPAQEEVQLPDTTTSASIPNMQHAVPESVAIARNTSQQTKPDSIFASNSTVVGGILGILISFFFIEKLIKKIWKKIRHSSDAE